MLRFLRRPNIATTPVSMHRLSSRPRPPFSSVPRWWSLELARREAEAPPPPMAPPDPTASHVSRFTHGYRNMASDSGVRGEEELGKHDRRPHIPSTKDFTFSLAERTTKEFIMHYGENSSAHGEDERRASVDVIFGDEDATLEVIDGEPDDKAGGAVHPSGCKLSSDEEEDASCVAENPPSCHADSVPDLFTFPASSHRDGSIFQGSCIWKKDYHITDRNETRLEAMMLSAPDNCNISCGTCTVHTTARMLQFFSLKLAKLSVEGASVQLYGYIAVRDELDPLLNYVVNVSRDDPIIVRQGSFIDMAGPKRGIDILGTILLEYDMKIKTGKQEQDDLQLIDGLALMDDVGTSNCFAVTYRIDGDCGGVDITASRLDGAVEATIEILISEVQRSFDLHLGCFVSKVAEEIRIFDGTVSESRSLKRCVVAVVRNTWMDLKFRVGAGSSTPPTEHSYSFKANKHGHATQERQFDFALISAKVTWSTLPRGWPVKGIGHHVLN